MQNRRDFITGLTTLTAALGLPPAFARAAEEVAGQAEGHIDASFGPAEPFSFDRLIARARMMAAQPYQPATVQAPDVLHEIDYDQHWRIRYRNEAALYPSGETAPVELFHPGRFFMEPVAIYQVAGGEARQVYYRRSYFDMPNDSPAQKLPDSSGFAGFRVMRPDFKPDWISFLGASYFRADGPERQYGLSARGLAINTGLPEPEEFPRFTSFWLGPAEDTADTMTCWALLDSPSVTGAYRFGLRREADEGGQMVTVTCQIFMREAVERLGIAPLTSMYWYAERDRVQGNDWRPEIHDSDGLAMETGNGERIWRPLINPQVIQTSSFFDSYPKGFGLIQRDRNFEHYQDDGVFYNRRPSAWVEPVGDWGEGSVQLIEIPTKDETFDNIVAFWMPAELPQKGQSMRFEYRLHWRERDPLPEQVAHTYATHQGHGGAPGTPLPEGVGKLVVDFEGGPLDSIATDAKIEPVIEVSGGKLLEPIAVRPVVGTKRWRLSFDFRPDGHDPVEIRAYLRRGREPLTETWITRAAAHH
jgi:periplasmic glucans biosynthesis protein